MLAVIVWLVIIIVWAAPAFPTYDLFFWVATFFIPPLILIPIIEAVSR